VISLHKINRGLQVLQGIQADITEPDLSIEQITCDQYHIHLLSIALIHKLLQKFLSPEMSQVNIAHMHGPHLMRQSFNLHLNLRGFYLEGIPARIEGNRKSQDQNSHTILSGLQHYPGQKFNAAM